jgi:hypothetical protein
MPWLCQTADDVKTGLALSLWPFATLIQTRVALPFHTAATINAHRFECRHVFQNENNYCFGCESALVGGYHKGNLAIELAISRLWPCNI